LGADTARGFLLEFFHSNQKRKIRDHNQRSFPHNRGKAPGARITPNLKRDAMAVIGSCTRGKNFSDGTLFA
jgi:hypothetical protein